MTHTTRMVTLIVGLASAMRTICDQCPTYPEWYLNCLDCGMGGLYHDICFTCADGFVPRQFGPTTSVRASICVACPANCRRCVDSNAPRCTQCYLGYVVQGSICAVSCNIGNCRECSWQNFCSRCWPGFGATGNGYCQACPTGCV